MRSLARFPGDRPDKKWRRSWVTAHRKWQGAEHAVLMITAHLGTPYVPAVDGAIHLDGVLAAAAAATISGGPGDDFTDCVVPVPAKLLWVADDGRPLWATSDLRPVGAVADVRIYWHSRYPDDRAHLSQHMAANTSAGRWKDYRVPLGAKAAEKLAGLCIGHEEHIRKLLTERVTHVGKKPSQGKGRVLRWEVVRLDMSVAEAEAAILAARPVPLAFFRETGRPLPPGARIVPRAGWTPPYWDARYHAEVLHG